MIEFQDKYDGVNEYAEEKMFEKPINYAETKILENK